MPTDPGAPRVPPRLSVITLGARHHEALARFYRGLGWPVAVEADDFIAFALHGAVLSLFPLDLLAADAHVVAAAPERGLRGFTLAMLVEEPTAVDAVIDAARAAGARVTKEPVDADLFVGRSAYFADPEDNHWEVVWLPDDSKMAVAVARAGGPDA